MASENPGRHNIVSNSAVLWNGGEDFAFPLLHNEAAHSGIGDSDPLSFLQLQVSPSTMGNFHGDPANYVGHASEDGFNSMASSVTQANQLLMSNVLDPLFPGDVFPAESNHAMSFSALNEMQCYDMNSNVQLHEVPPGIGSNLQLDINRSPINVGYELGGYGPDDWLIPGGPQLGTSKLDGSFLSLGYNGSAGSTLNSYGSAGDCNVSRLSFPPFRQEPHGGPFNPISDGAYGSLHSQNLVPSGNDGCLTLSHDDYGTLPGLTSGFDVSSSLPASRQHIKVNQLTPATNGRSPVKGNDMNARYNHPASKAYQTIRSDLFSNSQSRISESGCSWMSSLPSEAVSTRSSQQAVAEEIKGIGLRSDVVHPFQSPTVFPTLGTSSRNDQSGRSSPVIWTPSVGHGETANLSNKPGLQGIYQVSQERTLRVPKSETYTLHIAADQAVSSGMHNSSVAYKNSLKTEQAVFSGMHNSNVAYKSSLKRGPSSITNVTPRKMMRQHTAGPSCLNVQPVQLQSSVAKMTSVNPSISPMLTNISQPLLHQSLTSPVQNAPPQNTSANIAPAFTPFANSHSSNDLLPKTVRAPQQSSGVKSARAYPSSSPTCTNITQPQLHPSLVSQVQTVHLSKKSGSMSQPLYRPSVMSPLQTAKLPNSLEIRQPDFAASSYVSCSAATSLKAMPQPYITSLPDPLQNPVPRAAMGKTLPVVGAARNRPNSNHTIQGSLAISGEKTPAAPVASGRTPASGKEVPGLSGKTASTARNRLALLQSSSVRRLIESQVHALAAFEKKSPAHDASVMTPSTPHIKWQATDKPKASGFKCPLCKRDLAYTPEGPVSIPAIAPEVAVLHCGHAFHDHCLAAITPQDQPTDPPCIPCSMGEPVA